MSTTLRRFAATIVLAFGLALLAPAQPSAAHDGERQDVVESCSTTKRASGKHVTRVRWESGRTVRRVNLTARTRLFPGARELWSSSWGKPDPRVVGCAVLDNGTVLVRTKSRAKYAFVPPAPEAPPTAAPAAYGSWQVPLTLSVAGLDASWQAPEAAAAWNAALPEGRKITVTDVPCAEGQVGCIAVAERDLEGLQHVDVDAHRTWRGAAWVVAQDGVMHSCSIGLSPHVPATGRPRTMAHELGHCLGLTHWNTDDDYEWTVMSTEANTEAVTEWDLAWLSAVYAGA